MPDVSYTHVRTSRTCITLLQCSVIRTHVCCAKRRYNLCATNGVLEFSICLFVHAALASRLSQLATTPQQATMATTSEERVNQNRLPGREEENKGILNSSIAQRIFLSTTKVTKRKAKTEHSALTQIRREI